MKSSEHKAQDALKLSKPLVYDKVIRFPDKMARGESVAIVRTEWSYICNMRCKHCSIRELQARSDRRKMTLDDVKNLSRQAHELGLAQWVISGGEPLMFGDLSELIGAINPKLFYITIDTNGWYMTPETAKDLKDMGVDKVQLSIDNLDPEVHDEFRQKRGAWSRAVNSIEAMQKAGLHVLIQTVVDKQRAYSDELVLFIRFFNGLDVPVYIGYAKPVGAWAGHDEVMLTDADIAHVEALSKEYQVFTHLTPAYEYEGGCIAVKRMVNITRYGDVNPCPFMQEIRLGSLFEEPLKDIIERGMKRFSGHIPTCLMATVKDFVKNETYLPDMP